MNFLLGFLVGWLVTRRRDDDHQLPAHVTHGYATGLKAPKPGPPPPPAPGECPYDQMWDPVLQSCVPVLPWPIQQ